MSEIDIKRKKKGKVAKNSWASWERSFYDLCKEKRWEVSFDDCDSPILTPAKKRFENNFFIAVSSHKTFQVVITTSHGRRIKTIIGLLENKSIPFDYILDGETEAILSVDRKFLEKAVRVLDVKRKGRRKVSEKTLKALEEGRKKYQESKKQ